MEFALNHMTAARAGFVELLDLAQDCGCVGIELRNDLSGPLFDGIDPVDAGKMIRDRGLRLLTIAEVKSFDDWSFGMVMNAATLAGIAQKAGAEAISLIPNNDQSTRRGAPAKQDLQKSLEAIAPMLRDAELIGLIEPLGFDSCSIRHKAPVVQTVDEMGLSDCFKVVHDSFHHHLAADGYGDADAIGIVHISGATRFHSDTSPLNDEARGLVFGNDTLGNLEQIYDLEKSGNTAPYSFEAFSPLVHADKQLAASLRRSMEFIRSGLLTMAA